jgi:hypothetical protein
LLLLFLHTSLCSIFCPEAACEVPLLSDKSSGCLKSESERDRSEILGKQNPKCIVKQMATTRLILNNALFGLTCSWVNTRTIVSISELNLIYKTSEVLALLSVILINKI